MDNLPPIITPSMSFEESFDILFVRGGFLSFPSCWEFVKKFENLVDDRWIHAMCTCRLMDLLPHPMFGVLLFVPEIPSLEESCLAWRLARECCVSVVDIEITVKVIRIFCPPGKEGCVLFHGAWCPSDLHVKKSPSEWIKFATATADGVSFTRMWWSQEENLMKEGITIGEVVRRMAAKEKDMLRFKLISNAKKDLLDAKAWKVEQNKNMKAIQGKPESKKTGGKPVSIRLNVEELNCAEATAKSSMEKHQQAISALKKALTKTAVEVFDDNLAEIVASLTASFPRIKWSIKAILHSHFVKHSDWKIERQIHGNRWFTITEDPLTTLGYWQGAQA